MSNLIISVSGLRGILGNELSPEVAMRYAVAFSQMCPPAGPLVITRDSRPSGAMLTDAISAALNATGRATIDGGIAATPTTGVLIRSLSGIAGGIQISASHNPSQYNGIKLFSTDGRVIPKSQGEGVLQQYRQYQSSASLPWVEHDHIATRTVLEDTTTIHLEKVLATVDVAAIAKKRYKVLLDSNHGAGAILGKRLLHALGCEVVILGEEPDGKFSHTPEPTEENLQTVLAEVIRIGADIGFCQDPDADRLAIIDAAGRYIGEEYTVPLCIQQILSKRPKGDVVINCATSRMTLDVAAEYGVSCFRSAVGEANVVDLLLNKGAVFAGEGNGGPIDPQVGLVRDSFVGMAQVLESMALRRKTVAELADALPRYSMLKQKLAMPLDQVPEMVAKLSQQYRNLPQNTLDGLRIDWPDAWVLIRASNTEPIVRIIAEAPTFEQASQICEDIARGF